MAKNLAIDDGGEGIYTQTVNYGQGDVVEYYYDWDAAMRVAESIEGWHLPSLIEWDSLADAVGGTSTAGTYLKSRYGWSLGKGIDDYGFSAFPAGYENNDRFYSKGSYAYFWTATTFGLTKACCRSFSNGASMDMNTNDIRRGYSVRLIKDSE
jgi:uncharacterized protein (TIGR02145 family)